LNRSFSTKKFDLRKTIRNQVPNSTNPGVVSLPLQSAIPTKTNPVSLNVAAAKSSSKIFILKKHLNMVKNSLRVLVVDDDIDLLMLMERKLQQHGYLVESAVSLAEAEYVSAIFRPDLVLLDINVAGEDGRQLCWKMKHKGDRQNAKVVLMSGTHYPTSKVLYFGADGFIAKPFQTEFVEQKISSLFVNDQTMTFPFPVTITD
jgi:CheY-like chemotaxis protein